MMIKILVWFGSIACAVALYYIALLVYVHYFHRPKKLNHIYKFQNKKKAI